jgi:hypothetical protein
MLRRLLVPWMILAMLFTPMLRHDAAALQLVESEDAPAIIRVHAQPGIDVNTFANDLAAEFDLLEMRDGDDLFVLGGSTTIDLLRTRGYEASVQRRMPRARPAAYYGGYRTVAEHYEHLDAVAAAHPDLAQLIDYGDSWRKENGRANGHDLRAICITKLRPGDCALSPETDKPRLFIIAAMHARELSVAELAARWIDHLVDGYGIDADVTALLDSSEMWIVPLANPDGRHIVESGGDTPSYHRKNANTVDGPCAAYSPTSPYYAGSHPGIDLNRNGSWKWELRVTASDVACSSVYRGPSRASEPETVHLEALIRTIFRDQRGPSLDDAAPLTTTGAFITLHSFADQVILPWNYTTSRRAPNDAGLRALAFRMSAHNGYETGQSGEVLYSTSGSTDDFTYGEFGIPSYTFEVGPGYGYCADFMPPFSCVDEFWNENLGAFLYAAAAVREPYVLAHGPAPQAIAVTAAADGATVRVLFDDDAFGTNGFSRPTAQHVVSAELYLDTPTWAGGTPIAMQVGDGAADSLTEEFSTTVQLSVLDADRHIVYARAYDADGNPGIFASAWITPGAASVLPDIATAGIDARVVVTNAAAMLRTVVSTTLPITITAAQMQIDADDFISDVIELAPLDGVADSAHEVFTGTIDGALLAVGHHTATLRALTASAAYTPTREISFTVLPAGYVSVFAPIAVNSR